MQCRYCGFGNGEDDHRCLRCGRRIAGVVTAAPAGYAGANALAFAPVPEANETQEFPPVAPAASQPPLFAAPEEKVARKIIPFDQIQRHVTGRMTLPPQPAAPDTADRRPQVRKPNPPAASQPPAPQQAALDFLPSAPAVQRTLRTDVPAQIYCEQPVATPAHRLVAGAMDAAMIFLGFGVFALAAYVAGASFGFGKVLLMTLGASFILISLFYGLLFAMTRRETAGMSWTGLQLITFDGFALDGRTRAVRFASTWLSFCSGGLGLIWAATDEENLTWHDHISKTFPTFREMPRNFVRQRR